MSRPNYHGISSFKCLGLCAILLITSGTIAYAQKTCTSAISSDTNFTSVTWVASGGATVTECNDMASGAITFTGNVVLNIANTTIITITNDVTIDGDIALTAGNDSFLRVTGGFTVHVTGDVGDAVNNGAQYEVVTSGDHIIVDGTLYGKNNNAFVGSGTISGGTLNVKNNSTCGSPCPVSNGFDDCESGDSFCTTYSVLPVVLASFTAGLENGTVHLKWVTVSELNLSRFIVQHSGDGLSFSDIGEVNGDGYDKVDLKTTYTFLDKNPLIGNNYYRLKVIDIDERTEYFQIIRVSNDTRKKFEVFPNPLSGRDISYSVNFSPAESDEILIRNSLGVIIRRIRAATDEKQIALEDKLAAGIYFITYASERFNSTRSLIVH